MRHRQDIPELFSTFLQFQTDTITRWATDAKLRRSILGAIARSPDGTERFWVSYWHRAWREAAVRSTPQLADLHLLAYLQESCYWAAQRTLNKFSGNQYTLPDYFQMAMAESQVVLKGFSDDRGASLGTYGEMVFQSILRDGLRQRQSADLCTDWTLLRKISKKRLIEALQHAGLAEATIAQYKLAWTCFKALYVPSASAERLPKPDQALWEAIAHLYKTESTSSASGTQIEADQIEQWLSRCATWVRAYLYPPVASLNLPRTSEESGEIQDTLAAEFETPLTALIVQEEVTQRQTQQSQISQVLEAAIERLDAQSQTILGLYYQQDYTQQQIMKELSLSQASVSRRLSKAREALLKALVQWSEAELNNPPTPSLIGTMSTSLEEWLRARYRRVTATLAHP